MRCLVRTTGRAAVKRGVGGWRQWRHQTKAVRTLFHRVQLSRQAKAHPERVEEYLARCRSLVARVEGSVEELASAGAPAWTLLQIDHWLGHAKRQIDQVERRLVKGETIPHEEKLFSIFEEHTRWIMKGKAGRPVELGVPVCVIEDQHGFILHHRIMWSGSDVDVAVPMITETQERFPDLKLCSFDRGFHSPTNRVDLDELLEHNVLPRKGRLSKADREREGADEFVAARRQHPAVESAINNLEQRGLDRVLSYGAGRLRAHGRAVHRRLQPPPHRLAAATPRPQAKTTRRRLTAAASPKASKQARCPAANRSARPESGDPRPILRIVLN